MSKKLEFIMLIDDNPDDNFYHERVIRKNNSADKVMSVTDAEEALELLQREGAAGPQLIFLDVNMPGMNGIEFLHAYGNLPHRAVVVMLTTSENPDDKKRATAAYSISDFRTKPLSKEMLDEIIASYF